VWQACADSTKREDITMKANYRQYLAGLTLLVMPLAFAAYAQSDRDRENCREGPEIEYGWDLIHITSFSPNTVVFPGGSNSALANDGSKLTLTGHGTFEPGEPGEVTGGGTWTTLDASGAQTGNGRYRVTELIRFTVAPGLANATAIDNIPGATGDLTDNRAALLFVKIAYSDGSKGVLVVSCALPGGPGPDRPGAPSSLFEGITASKGFVDYWNRVAPVPGVDGNRTLFHVRVKHGDRDAEPRDAEP
jgi:hypothetical protein